MKKRLRKKLHRKFIEDVAFEISISSQWRGAIFKLSKGQHLSINSDSDIQLPLYVAPYFRRFNLQYTVCIVEECGEDFDKGLVIFEFASKSFAEIKWYSGNNPMHI